MEWLNICIHAIFPPSFGLSLSLSLYLSLSIYLSLCGVYVRTYKWCNEGLNKIPLKERKKERSCFMFYLPGFSLLHAHVKLSEVSTGTATASTGMEGLYFATSLAVAPSLVMTMIICAFTLWAVLTAVEARDSKGSMGLGACLMMSL